VFAFFLAKTSNLQSRASCPADTRAVFAVNSSLRVAIPGRKIPPSTAGSATLYHRWRDGERDNVQLLETGVRSLRNGGGTAMYDAIYRACREKLSKDRGDHPVRRAIIVISDGEDNQSEVTKAMALEMAQRAEVIIYAISTDDSGLILRGDKAMQQIADATGGRAFFPFKMKDIKNSFAAIEDELRSQYVVSYKPADFDADGRYRSIEITALKKDLQVRARKGYYAPRQ